MTVSELIAALSKFQPDTHVEVNNNRGGNVYDIECVEYFPSEHEEEYSTVVIQVNV